MPLRDYQVKGVTDLSAKMRRGIRRILYRGETGSGKTVLYDYMATRAAERGNDVLILCHRTETIEQTADKLEASYGIIKAGFRSSAKERIQIASVQTLVRRLENRPPARLVIWDECHHVVANTYQKIMNAYPDAFHLGFTASPCRLDGRGLGNVFQSMVLGPSNRELTAQGYLCPAVVYSPARIDVSGVHHRAGEFNADELEPRVKAITGDILDHYQRLGGGRPGIGFAPSVQSSRDMAEVFQNAGIVAKHVDATTPPDLRKSIIGRLGRGVQFIWNCALFDEGVDVPGVSCVIMANPSESFGKVLQMVGRGLRPAPGKTQCIILDHADNCIRHHWLPHHDVAWTLEGTTKRTSRSAPSNMRMCSRCFYCHDTAPTCPECGYVYPIKERTLCEKRGELALLSFEERKAQEHAADTFEALLDLELERGYKGGWACQQWRARHHAVGLDHYKQTEKRHGYKPGWGFIQAKLARVI